MPHDAIRVSELDPNFKLAVTVPEACCDITACFACGTCTSGCPLHAVYPEHDPRKLARMINLGMKGRALDSRYIWYCSECYLCEQRCPQMVKFSSVWELLKNMAVKEGYPPPVSVDEDMCSGCGICVSLCPYEAIEVGRESGNGTAQINTALCLGCGVCAAACPSGAISVKLFEDSQLFAQMETPAACPN